jgi:hypothetical protein
MRITEEKHPDSEEDDIKALVSLIIMSAIVEPQSFPS